MSSYTEKTCLFLFNQFLNNSFPRSVAHLKDVLSSDQVTVARRVKTPKPSLSQWWWWEERTNAAGEMLVGNAVTNALFHFSKGAEILKLAIQHFTQVGKIYLG